MDKSVTLEENCHYDIEAIIAVAKKRFIASVIQIVLYSVLLVISVLAIILYSTHLAVFIIAVVIACISAFLYLKQIKKIKLSDYNEAFGEIVNVHKEITSVRKTVGGINLFTARKYDSYRKSETNITVSISENNTVRTYNLSSVSDKQSEYYESGGTAMHIWGTRYPVKPEADKWKWLCPICGGFNTNEKKTCERCNNKIIK